MIAVLFAILLATLAGWAITRLLDRDLRGSALVGASILIGCGYAALMMFLLTAIHIPWSRTSVIIGLLLPLPLFLVSVGAPALGRPNGGRGRPNGGRGRPPLLIAIDAITLLLILGHAVFATWLPMVEWDWFGIWGLKARTFFD